MDGDLISFILFVSSAGFYYLWVLMDRAPLLHPTQDPRTWLTDG